MKDTALTHDVPASCLEKDQAHTVDLLIGTRIRERRVMRGFTQQQLGSMTGVTLQQIYKYERGLNRISVGRLYVIAAALDVPLSWFFEGIKDSPRDPDAPRWKGRSIEMGPIPSALDDEKLRQILTTILQALAPLREDDMAHGHEMTPIRRDLCDPCSAMALPSALVHSPDEGRDGPQAQSAMR
jgi:transcriptional regulator with XRE-family HTH domain